MDRTGSRLPAETWYQVKEVDLRYGLPTELPRPRFRLFVNPDVWGAQTALALTVLLVLAGIAALVL